MGPIEGNRNSLGFGGMAAEELVDRRKLKGDARTLAQKKGVSAGGKRSRCKGIAKTGKGAKGDLIEVLHNLYLPIHLASARRHKVAV
eukprot:COSAG01_NODE_30947_length_606_cov_1.869822_2_plen_87_part_00